MIPSRTRSAKRHMIEGVRTFRRCILSAVLLLHLTEHEPRNVRGGVQRGPE